MPRIKGPEYKAWNNMKDRCSNPNNPRFMRYGGRGITVCERWLKFDAFFADVGPRPSPRHSIDRFPNNDGNYEPGNVRWATTHEQANNKCNAHLITLGLETMTVTRWAMKLRTTVGHLVNRIHRLGVERALNEPFRRRGKRSDAGGSRRTKV